MRLINKQILIFTLVFCSFILCGCGKKEKSESKSSNDQVVAKVNGEEITIHQVNFQLSRMGQMSQEQAKLASKKILANLITQEILKQKALEAKLDQDPAIIQTLAFTKDQLLAQAYLQKTASTTNKASATEVDGFYREHPELFENRRVFRLQELVVNIPKEKFAETELALKAIKDINQIATWLRDNNYPFTVNSNVKAAEELPMALLKKLQGLKDGEMLLVPNEKTFNILQITASQTQPISRTKATPIIEQYFFNQNKNKVLNSEIIALNEKAKVEFIGAFSDMKKADLVKQGTINAEASPQPESKSQTKSTQEDRNVKSTLDVNPSSINKGLSGL